MNPVSRRELKTATWGLAGVAVLGVALGIVNTASSPSEISSDFGGRGTPIPMNPAMARSVEAKAIAPDAAPPAPSPKAVAAASTTDEAEAASDSNADSETGPSSDAPAPPELYAPPEPSPAPPASSPAADNNLPPY